MKTVLITGANGNLGVAVTHEFLQKGHRVIATIRSEEARKDLPEHANLEIAVIDLNDETATLHFINNAIAKYTIIDAALLLVGGFGMGDISDTNMADIKKMISLNFETAYHVAQPLFQHIMRNGNGRLVFVGGRPAIDPKAGKGLLAYGLSKSLLFKLAEYLNEEAKGKNITATVVVPSILDTTENRKSMPGADTNTWVKPAALAEILEFIVSDKSHPLRETVLKVYNNA